MLQFCVSQQINETPFTFTATGVRVYSFEEALYHVFHNWRESADELFCDGMIAWVAQLGHSYLAERMKELSRNESFTRRALGFLRLVEYFDQEELAELQPELEAWEIRRKWKQLKEQADSLVAQGEPDKAIPLYRRALKYDHNAALLNNMGVAYLQQNKTKEALCRFSGAMEKDPGNTEILLHYIEAAILGNNFDEAEGVLEKFSNILPDSAEIPFLTGLIASQQNDYQRALAYFSEACAIDPTETYYVYKTADIHLAMHQYENALTTLDDITTHDADYHAKESEIHAAMGDLPSAIAAMEKAVETTSDAKLYALLASYYRNAGDITNAEEAIAKALAIAPHNSTVHLENARIKKILGHTYEYQAALDDILNDFKVRYRASFS